MKFEIALIAPLKVALLNRLNNSVVNGASLLYPILIKVCRIDIVELNLAGIDARFCKTVWYQINIGSRLPSQPASGVTPPGF